MGTPHNFLTHLFLYPLVAVLLAACGTASAPVASQVTTTAAAAEMTVTPSATSEPAPTATVAVTATTAPTATSAPTDTPAQTVMSTPTETSAPTPTIAAPATALPVRPTVVPIKPTVMPLQPTPQPVAPRASVKVPVEIKLFQFKPNVLAIKAGTTVVWTNQDNIEHSVTSGTPPTPGGAFDSGFFTQGQTFTFTFSNPGTYSYFCMRHNSMVGTVEVSAP